jgi:hypothetical protein
MLKKSKLSAELLEASKAQNSINVQLHKVRTSRINRSARADAIVGISWRVCRWTFWRLVILGSNIRYTTTAQFLGKPG